MIDAHGRLLGRTRMVHITDYACFHEKGYDTPGGTGAPVCDAAAGRIGVAICYDRGWARRNGSPLRESRSSAVRTAAS